MNKYFWIATLCVLLLGCQPSSETLTIDQDIVDSKPDSKSEALQVFTSSSALLESLTDDAWRTLSSDNTLVMSLDSGEVIIELADIFAPEHVANIKTLVTEKYFDGNYIIRSQDNYVAQWGDPEELNSNPSEASFKSIGSAAQTLDLEFYRDVSQVPFTKILSRDAYADEVGFTQGLPTAVNPQGAYLTHCYGMVGVARGNEANSGNATGLYAVTGHSPRHLDLNVTLVGKVWMGMEHLSSLPRGKGVLGFYTSIDEATRIQSVAFLDPSRVIEVMRTDTPEFSRYVELRTTRNEEWFVEATGKIELCNVLVPVRER
jgi:peptidylprolyl isomerase